jgi:hypothetical protein
MSRPAFFGKFHDVPTMTLSATIGFAFDSTEVACVTAAEGGIGQAEGVGELFLMKAGRDPQVRRQMA